MHNDQWKLFKRKPSDEENLQQLFLELLFCHNLAHFNLHQVKGPVILHRPETIIANFLSLMVVISIVSIDYYTKNQFLVLFIACMVYNISVKKSIIYSINLMYTVAILFIMINKNIANKHPQMQKTHNSCF